MVRNCLLCENPLQESFSLLEILTLKNKKRWTCSSCQNQFVSIERNHCPRCYKDDCQGICSDCLKWEEKGHLVDHYALYKNNQAMFDFFNLYKTQGDYLLRNVFSDMLRKHIAQKFSHYHVIPIPSSEKQIGKLGYDPVKAVIEASKIPYEDLIQCNEIVEKKGSTMNSEKNLSKDYSLKPEIMAKLCGRKLLIVCDKYQTGNTIYMIKNLLIANGFQEIKSLSIVR